MVASVFAPCWVGPALVQTFVPRPSYLSPRVAHVMTPDSLPDAKQGYSLAPVEERPSPGLANPDRQNCGIARLPDAERLAAPDPRERQLTLRDLMALVAVVAVVGSLWRWTSRPWLAFTLGILILSVRLFIEWTQTKSLAVRVGWLVLLILYLTVAALVAAGLG